MRNLSVTNKSPSGQLDFLSGLRGLAALWVVLSHIWIFQSGVVTSSSRWGFLTNWLIYSHLAVDIFIVLSGYCLMLSVAREGKLKGGAIAFYKKRARRILPPYFIALACSILLWAVVDKQITHISAVAVFANLFLVQDMLLRYNIFDGPLWSVAVEWRIYFLFPIMVFIWKRFGRRATLATAGLFAFAVTASIFHYYPAFSFACPWYVFLFAMGLCAATIKSDGISPNLVKYRPFCEASLTAKLLKAVPLSKGDSEPQRAGGAFARSAPRRSRVSSPGTAHRTFTIGEAFVASGLALAALLLLFPVTPQGGDRFGRAMPVIDVAAGILTASFLVLVNNGWRAPRLLLSSRPLVKLGLISYSVYLIHAPLLHTLAPLAMGLLKTTQFSPLQFAAFAVCDIVITLGLGGIFFHFFERPFLSTKRTLEIAIQHTIHGDPVLSTGNRCEISDGATVESGRR